MFQGCSEELSTPISCALPAAAMQFTLKHCYTQPTWRLSRVAVKSFWVTSLKSLLQGTDLLLTFNRVRIPCITFFSLFASVIGSDTAYYNFSCYLSPFVSFVYRCVQTSHGDLSLIYRLLSY